MVHRNVPGIRGGKKTVVHIQAARGNAPDGGTGSIEMRPSMEIVGVRVARMCFCKYRTVQIAFSFLRRCCCAIKDGDSGEGASLLKGLCPI